MISILLNIAEEYILLIGVFIDQITHDKIGPYTIEPIEMRQFAN